MTRQEMKDRTRRYGIRVLRVADALPRGRTHDLIARQLARCGTSVGANYRSACRAKSTRDFIAKLGIVEEEADESLYWLELIVEAGLMKPRLVEDLMHEGNEIVAIIVATIRSSRRKPTA
jgi:four helix bundle protein